MVAVVGTLDLEMIQPQLVITWVAIVHGPGWARGLLRGGRFLSHENPALHPATAQQVRQDHQPQNPRITTHCVSSLLRICDKFHQEAPREICILDS